jgi:hypothetical protein
MKSFGAWIPYLNSSRTLIAFCLVILLTIFRHFSKSSRAKNVVLAVSCIVIAGTAVTILRDIWKEPETAEAQRNDTYSAPGGVINTNSGSGTQFNVNYFGKQDK